MRPAPKVSQSPKTAMFKRPNLHVYSLIEETLSVFQASFITSLPDAELFYNSSLLHYAKP